MDENEQKVQELETQIRGVNQSISTLKESMKTTRSHADRQPMIENLKQLRTQKELLIREQSEYCKLVHETVALGVAAIQAAKEGNQKSELQKIKEEILHEG